MNPIPHHPLHHIGEVHGLCRLATTLVHPGHIFVQAGNLLVGTDSLLEGTVKILVGTAFTPIAFPLVLEGSGHLPTLLVKIRRKKSVPHGLRCGKCDIRRVGGRDSLATYEGRSRARAKLNALLGQAGSKAVRYGSGGRRNHPFGQKED
jgi:hypothetical protein